MSRRPVTTRGGVNPPAHPLRETVFHSHSAEQTREFGRDLAARLTGGEVIALIGPLGSGKTTFVQALATGLGVSVPVKSPSFILVARLHAPIPLVHIDAYRLSRPEELEDLAFAELCDGRSVVVVEWADKVAGALPADRLEMHFSGSGEERNIVFRWISDLWRRRLEVLQELAHPGD